MHERVFITGVLIEQLLLVCQEIEKYFYLSFVFQILDNSFMQLLEVYLCWANESSFIGLKVYLLQLALYKVFIKDDFQGT